MLMRHRGIVHVDWIVELTAAVFNLVCMRRLMMVIALGAAADRPRWDGSRFQLRVGHPMASKVLRALIPGNFSAEYSLS